MSCDVRSSGLRRSVSARLASAGGAAPLLLAGLLSACGTTDVDAGVAESPSAPAPAGEVAGPPPASDTGSQADPDTAAMNSGITSGVTYQVGPGKPYATLGAVASRLNPGDTVRVYPGASAYAGGVILSRAGTAAMPINIVGVRVNGARPAISGGTTTIEFRADHYVFSGFDLSGGTSRVLYHHADDITIRDTFVHDCPSHGVLGADSDSGSLTMEYVEVARCGSGDTRHPIYIATDETAHPGAVFRLRYSYIHDGRGGNAIKSRAERNEVYYNWIEGGYYREIELIGPDGQSPALKREDSDVVGNVFVKTGTAPVARIGGDGTGDTGGRYRFVNNTFILQPGSTAVIQAFDSVQSLEMHNNVFYRSGGGGVTVLADGNARWVGGKRVVGGSYNWVPTGSTVPSEFKGTLMASAPGFSNGGAYDYRPVSSSPLIGVGVLSTVSPSGYAFPSPLALPLYLPPQRQVQALGMARPRPDLARIAIGALAAP